MVFPKPFSKRNRPAPNALSYDIPEMVRHRIVQNFFTLSRRGDIDLSKMFADAGQRVRMEYGGLYGKPSAVFNPYQNQKDPGEVAAEHFEHAPPEEAIDFLEFCFQSEGCRLRQLAVDTVNDIFKDEGIGFEFSPFSLDVRTNDRGGTSIRVLQFPEAIKKSEELVHSTTIMPTLTLLAGVVFQTANKEMLEAHKHFRDGDFTAAINSAGQALETVIKTICERKGWGYTKDKDALGKLLQVLEQKGLIKDVHRDAIQKTSGDIRNKYGAHGKGPNPTYGFATTEIAEHMIQITSAHILFLVRTAKI